MSWHCFLIFNLSVVATISSLQLKIEKFWNLLRECRPISSGISLHPTVLRRIENSSLYGNEYNIDDVVGDISKQIFFGDLRGNVNSHRQRLQTMYVEELFYILENEDYMYSSTAEAVAHQNLRTIQGWLALLAVVT